MQASTAHANPNVRIVSIDMARGVALLAMTAYHFAWDLEMFGLLERGFMASPSMIISARLIAGSFLFLVGFSFWLAHGQGMRWRAFVRRLAQIVAASGLITLATWFAIPDAFIFFGILHSIALGSVLALAFLRLPWWLTAAAGLAIVALREALRTEWLDAPLWWWTGLSRVMPVSNDYVPVFPFFGVILLGLAAARLASSRNLLRRMAGPAPSSNPARALEFIGRHSLVYYLAHQPVMIAILYAALWLTGRI